MSEKKNKPKNKVLSESNKTIASNKTKKKILNNNNEEKVVTENKSSIRSNKKKQEVIKMKNQALGLVECRGLTAATEAADAMMKAANIKLVSTEKIGSGLVCVMIRGDVGAVKAATEVGSEAVSRLGELVAVHVIPRPHEDLENILPKSD